MRVGLAIVGSVILGISCVVGAGAEQEKPQDHADNKQMKPVIYQLLPRLFGNKQNANVEWGSVAQNGVGKFEDINNAALSGIKELGASHIWYTGVLRHALITDYSAYNIPVNDPDIVKGRAGSPYAITDYYDLNPDLANDVNKRFDEFSALINRTHRHGMKVIIDIVPNHVAREYHSSFAESMGKEDFGVKDNNKVAYAKHNNFYYIPDNAFVVPSSEDYKVLGGHPHPLSDEKFTEFPAKWTGNINQTAAPSINDWYETVKLNYGISPDGKKDFVSLPDNFSSKSLIEQYEFWQKQKDLPDTWLKMRDIVFFWMSKGVDGFRFDMAEMVPIEFWNFLNASIKYQNPNIMLIAEIYNPKEYRNFIRVGHMDYLYHKVDLYDNLKAVMQGREPASILADTYHEYTDIQSHLLHFLENHDEQRIASPEFAGDANKGRPALVVSALLNDAPMLLYFAQEVGEDGSENMGFGKASRTSIFDYAGVPSHQKWMNEGKFDGALLSQSQKDLRSFYVSLMQIATRHKAMEGKTALLHEYNLHQPGYTPHHFSFVRYSNEQALLIVVNLSNQASEFSLSLPAPLLEELLVTNDLPAKDLLSQQSAWLRFNANTNGSANKVGKNGASINIQLPEWGSAIYELSKR